MGETIAKQVISQILFLYFYTISTMVINATEGMHSHHRSLWCLLLPWLRLCLKKQHGFRKDLQETWKSREAQSQHYPKVLPSPDPMGSLCPKRIRWNWCLLVYKPRPQHCHGGFGKLKYWACRRGFKFSNTYSLYHRLLDYKTKIRNFASSDTPRQTARLSQIPPWTTSMASLATATLAGWS